MRHKWLRDGVPRGDDESPAGSDDRQRIRTDDIVADDRRITLRLNQIYPDNNLKDEPLSKSF
jgi:hypothetical protein